MRRFGHWFWNEANAWQVLFIGTSIWLGVSMLLWVIVWLACALFTG